jgi:hypothetical protein
MLKPLARRAAFVLTGGAVALAGVALPAQAAGIPGWRSSTTYSVQKGQALFTSIDAISARDAWATGLSVRNGSTNLQPFIRQWNGRAWQSVTLPPATARAWARGYPLVSAIAASSPSSVWIFGGLTSPAYLRLHGKRWTTGRLPGASGGDIVIISSAVAFSPSNVWAFGVRVDEATEQPTATPYAAHYNGSRWSLSPVPGNAGIMGVSAASASSIWAVEGTDADPVTGIGATSGRPAVLHWTASGGWQEPAQPALPAGSHLSSVLAEPQGKVLVGGSEPNARKGRSPMTLTWNGTSWSAPSEAAPTSAKWEIASLVPDGRGGTWALGDGTNGNSAELWHLVGARWLVAKPNFGRHTWIMFQLSAVPHSDSVWGAGAVREGKTTDGLIGVAGATPR